MDFIRGNSVGSAYFAKETLIIKRHTNVRFDLLILLMLFIVFWFVLSHECTKINLL